MDKKLKRLFKMFDVKKNDDISASIEYAYFKHRNQTREDGSPYIMHPIRVANKVIQYEKEFIESHIIGAILHDTIEDSDATYEDISSRFGIGVANLVQELTSDDELKHKMGKTNYLKEKLEKMDKEAFLIKLCDRLDNVEDLINASDEFKIKYIVETEELVKYLLDNVSLNEAELNIIKDICYKLAEYDQTLKCMRYRIK